MRKVLTSCCICNSSEWHQWWGGANLQWFRTWIIRVSMDTMNYFYPTSSVRNHSILCWRDSFRDYNQLVKEVTQKGSSDNRTNETKLISFSLWVLLHFLLHSLLCSQLIQNVLLRGMEKNCSVLERSYVFNGNINTLFQWDSLCFHCRALLPFLARKLFKGIHLDFPVIKRATWYLFHATHVLDSHMELVYSQAAGNLKGLYCRGSAEQVI